MKPLPAAWAAIVLLGWLAGGASVRADDAAGTSNSPYIDSLKAKLAPPSTAQDPSVQDPYIESLKAKNPPPADDGSYTEKLKQKLGPAPSDNYTEAQKAKLGPTDSSSAIEAVKEGHSQLKARMAGSIHNAFGFRFGVKEVTQNTTAASSQQSFNAIYGSSFPIDLDIFYEYQPWHSELFGEIGFYGEGGVGFYQGVGNFQYIVHNADNGGNFSDQSGTKFNFIAAPFTVGVDFRLNTAKYFRPFVMAGGTMSFFYESRNDGGTTHMGYSFGFTGAAGVNILMDWVSPTASWDLYAEHGILHYYLTLQYSLVMTPIVNFVNYAASGPFVGFTFEF